MTRRAARDLSPLPHLPSVELRDALRALGRATGRRLQRRHHRVSLENDVVDAQFVGGEPAAQAASHPVTLAQSCSLNAVADAAAHAGPPPEGLDGPGALSARGYTDTPVHLAPLDVGALALPPCGFQPRGLDELVGPSFARVSPASQCKVAAKGSAGGSSAGRWPTARVCRPSCQVPPAIQGTFACSLRAWHDQISKKSPSSLWSLGRLEKEWRRRLIIDARIPNTACVAPDAVEPGQSFARVNVDTNEPIFVSGVDIKVAFYALGLPKPFQAMFALDPVEAWEVEFARVVDEGTVDSGVNLCIPCSPWFIHVGIKL